VPKKKKARKNPYAGEGAVLVPPSFMAEVASCYSADTLCTGSKLRGVFRWKDRTMTCTANVYTGMFSGVPAASYAYEVVPLSRYKGRKPVPYNEHRRLYERGYASMLVVFKGKEYVMVGDAAVFAVDEDAEEPLVIADEPSKANVKSPFELW
jgi:hypothetical protein